MARKRREKVDPNFITAFGKPFVTGHYRLPGEGCYDTFKVPKKNGGFYKYSRAQISLDGKRVTLYGKNDAVLNRKVKNILSFQGEKTSLEKYLAHWLETVKGNCRPATYELYAGTARRYITPKIGRMKLAKLTSLRLRELLNDLAQDGIGDRTRQQVHIILSQVLKQAFHDEMITKNPMSAVDKPTAEKRDQHILSLEETKQLLQTAKGTRNYALIRTALMTGMRQGELFALQWSDVNLDEGYSSRETRPLYVQNDL